MSIQDEINRINQNMTNAYSALGDMGATLPETQNSENLANAIRTIPQSGSGGGDSSTLIVKAVPVLDFSNGVTFSGIASIDKSVAEILTAANAGKNVLLEFDVGVNIGIVQYARFVMTLYSDNNLNFDGVFDMSGSGSPSFIRVTGSKNTEVDNWTVSMAQLATV